MTPLLNPSVLVLAIGEAHQLLHILGPARELFRSGIKTDILVATDWHERLIASHAPELASQIVRAPLFNKHRPIYQCPPRLPNLLLSLIRISQYDAILTPERTSTVLRRILGKRCPSLVHILHGAGDRAQGYEGRIRLFDLVFVAGKKDYDAFLNYKLATAETCHVIGYCKFDVLPETPPKFFENDLPVVLYNPHFDTNLGSWIAFGPELLERFSSTPEFNFIIAPHLRLRGKGRRLFDELSRSFVRPNLRFDGGSLHSINMDYTRAADIYVGDVSSQVYEFLRTPKPCVFIDVQTTDWSNNPFYRHWTFGKVAKSPAETLECIKSAHADHSDFMPAQQAGFAAAIAPAETTPSARAAEIIHQFLTKHKRQKRK
ncbi:conserved hypothetical protein [Hyphomonas neptunium ATCC 15444]|uniref:CDP-glycerol:poly(Glycerophosphate) glycerophosphotransferase n=2 Tax=Hyphomonas TaxID=85 RepID=Q0C1V5_HYPNA|nr:MULTISPECIES: hypothetical protein [Hyphomonas]ABI75740.1 conserved hypothetical protein [Hyphomonas neptunium ATCC 15444]